MWFKMLNESFICENCNKEISPHTEWSARNHCPSCLYSKHLDKDYPWDRSSKCWWLMFPDDIEYKKNKWYMLKHICKKCDKIILNKIAPDDDFIWFTNRRNEYLKFKI